MKIAQPHSLLRPVAVILSLALSSCAAAAVGAGAGAGAIAYTDRGAQGEVKGDIREVTENTRKVFREMGIQTSEASSQESGKTETLQGKSTKAEVSVEINATGEKSSHVEVVARESTLKWNKDYAKEVLSKIVQKS